MSEAPPHPGLAITADLDPLVASAGARPVRPEAHQ
jgi:hypothetical protein